MKILLADDHPLFREGIALLLRERESTATILQAATLMETLESLARHPDIDLLLLDLHMPGMDGTRSVESLRARHPEVPIAILSASEAPNQVRAMLNAGVAGFIPKSSTPPVMVGAIQLILGGGSYIPPQGLGGDIAVGATTASAAGNGLTAKQRQVLALLVAGKPNKTICKELDISEGTVKHHIAAIYRALDVNNRTEAAAAARRLGITD